MFRNINEAYGDPTLFNSIREMEQAIRDCGYDLPEDGLREGRDYEMVVSIENFKTIGDLLHDAYERDDRGLQDAIIAHLSRPGWHDDLPLIKEMNIEFLAPHCTETELKNAISDYQDEAEEHSKSLEG